MGLAVFVVFGKRKIKWGWGFWEDAEGGWFMRGVMEVAVMEQVVDGYWVGNAGVVAGRFLVVLSDGLCPDRDAAHRVAMLHGGLAMWLNESGERD